MNANLVKKVIRQLGSDGKETLRDVYNHDAAAGWPGFTYYTDTVKFFKNNRREIVEEVENLAEELGEDAVTMVCNFGCIRDTSREMKAEVARALYGNIKSGEVIVPNALAWFALEEAAREVYDR